MSSSSSLQNPFLEEWRDCLVAYYAQVLQRNEPDLEASVRQLLLRVGVAEERVMALRAQTLPEPALELEPTPSEPELSEPELEPEPASSELELRHSAPEPPVKPKKEPPKQLSFF
ncbi:MAG: hypothetical protein CUN49_02535 [Candidatus Thermofonsia Clade 1 bacterium]|jgi:hypothetical protein|uniref:Uncharacterized protein n=1 Tax=Candidatus Thermofonsia Clade 1 bacterium TaxID=2364210 RepID=A0A2M8PHI5_9CHLR|nr:MAG: hypothetical protein CUN49_02535 [Candidatus Thermofonsia Clade 1 bacterium]RMF53442.1 MAG: hypothetical protein D6749_02305 [Chloroflexota bacterium]